MTAERIRELESVEFKWELSSVYWSEQSVVRISGRKAKSHDSGAHSGARDC